MKIPEIKLPPRDPESHKGTYGKIFILAGSRGMTGAATLVAEASVRGGAGLVTLGIPQSLNAILEVKTTCSMTLPLPEEGGTFSEKAWEEIKGWLSKSTLLVLGPGISTGLSVQKLVHQILKELTLPFVLDADGINNLAKALEILKGCSAPGILTPHLGEFCRISGYSKEEILSDPEGKASAFAKEMGKVVLLKGHRTVVTDGEKVYRNTTGNPGMATGGSGDVLTGLIGALMAQGLTPWEAGVLGAYIHGRAGDMAADKLGQIGLCATDLIDFLPLALKEHHGF